MYNPIMPPDTYQIRTCLSCGLRYPMTNENLFGIRCPVCLGETELTLRVEREANDLTPVASLPSASPSSKRTGNLTVLLDNIRSAWNVGSIFRSADGFGFTHVYICGITPTPENDAVMKTSLGAEDSVTWSYHRDAVKLIRGLKKEGWQIWALEDHERSLDFSTPVDLDSSYPLTLILGNEKTGVDPGLLEMADKIFYIPMQGKKTSFNVAIAFGIAAYQLTGLSS